MASSNQRLYIKNLAVQRLKEFKEFKEMIYSEGIVSRESETVANADSVDTILDATTDLQASKIIDALLARKEPVRSRTYATKRAERVSSQLEKTISKIRSWDFDELQRIQ